MSTSGSDALVVRAAVAADAQAICDLSRRAILVSAADHYTAPQLRAWADRRTLAAHQDMIRDTTAVVAVPERSRTIVGFTTVALEAVGALETGEVDQLFVDPGYGGRGVGRALLGRVDTLAVAAGLGRLVTHASWRALPLFERCGYRRVEVETVTLGEVELTRTLMRKNLLA